MLKLFFDRYSKVVILMEGAGIFFTIGWIWRWPVTLLFWIYLFGYLWIRFCAGVRWHKEAKRYEGLELHFKKSLIPASYILAIVSGIGFFGGPSVVSYFLLWMAVILLAVIGHANIILLYLFLKDKNTTPINYFSANKYTQT